MNLCGSSTVCGSLTVSPTLIHVPRQTLRSKITRTRRPSPADLERTGSAQGAARWQAPAQSAGRQDEETRYGFVYNPVYALRTKHPSGEREPVHILFQGIEVAS